MNKQILIVDSDPTSLLLARLSLEAADWMVDHLQEIPREHPAPLWMCNTDFAQDMIWQNLDIIASHRHEAGQKLILSSFFTPNEMQCLQLIKWNLPFLPKPLDPVQTLQFLERLI